MKRLSLLGILLLSFTACKKDSDPESQPTANYNTFPGSIGSNDNSTCFSSDGNLLICGNTGYGADLSVLKITKTGTQIWRKDFNAGIMSTATGITERNGEIFVCGQTQRNYALNKADVLLTKLSATGDTIWTKTYGTTEDDHGRNIIATSDGNILISGITYGFGVVTYCDIYLIKVDPDGNILWEASYPDIEQEVAYNLMETQNGEYLITGTNEDTDNSGRQLYLLKVNASGQQVWNKKIGSAWKWGYSSIETASGDLLICGEQYNPFQTSQVMLIKTDNLGNVIWSKEFGESASEEGNSIKQNPDGSFTITGRTQINGQSKVILIKIDENGNQLWFKKFNDYYGGNALNLLKDGDDNILTGNRNEGIFMTRTDGNGNFK
jgi:hypothetical protein